MICLDGNFTDQFLNRLSSEAWQFIEQGNRLQLADYLLEDFLLHSIYSDTIADELCKAFGT